MLHKYKNWLIAGGIIILFIFTPGCQYNNMVRMKENVESQWSNVENVYQRRMDLIPNLVNTVKGYAEHEQETFKQVTEARSKAAGITINADDLNQEKLRKFQQAQEQLSSALSRLLAVREDYPQLKANENFQQLQAQLEGTENRIATERRRYNEVAKKYNSTIKTFPNVIIANLTGFEEKAYFEMDKGADKAPEVEF